MPLDVAHAVDPVTGYCRLCGMAAAEMAEVPPGGPFARWCPTNARAWIPIRERRDGLWPYASTVAPRDIDEGMGWVTHYRFRADERAMRDVDKEDEA